MSSKGFIYIYLSNLHQRIYLTDLSLTIPQKTRDMGETFVLELAGDDLFYFFVSSMPLNILHSRNQVPQNPSQ